MKEKIRHLFIYLAFISIILGSAGILMLTGDITGQAVRIKNSYNTAEIAEHSNKEDCWVAFNGRVYDITLFLHSYSENLNDKCGQIVGLSSFSDYEKDILEEYQIGLLE